MQIRTLSALCALLLAACSGSSDSSSTASAGGAGATDVASPGAEDTSGGSDDDVAAQTDPGPAACTKGELGCACFGNGTCLAKLVCQAGTCAQCETGAEGCACFGNGTCRTGLACEDGACVTSGAGCTAGTAGCPCLGDGTCSGGLECTGGICASPGCTAGEEGCACDTGACGEGLACSSGFCIKAVCPAGTLDCPCFANGTCGFQAGVALACEAGLCVVPACPAGGKGCGCKSDGTCNTGLTCVGAGPAATCEQPIACIPGTEGCECGPGGACEAGLYCNQGVCDELGCAPGAVGCLCDLGDCAGVGTVCNPSGWCEQAPCPAGTEGCPCAAAGSCGMSTRGEAMSCEAGLCVAPSCVPGQTGCPCAYGADCESAGDTCGGGFCRPTGCAPGQLNCACAGGSCLAGLACRDGVICVSNTGHLGGPCLDTGYCNTGLKCLAGGCVLCTAGSLGCTCGAVGACGAGLVCYEEHCADPSTLDLPPDVTTCYTPCNGPLPTAGGAYLPCPADGLMAGCHGGTVCNQGSCTPPGAAKPTCQTELDCPDHQTCKGGGCYSDCELDSDCPDGKVCNRKVCRTPCTTEASDCPSGQSCLTDDGAAGFCRLVAAPSGSGTGTPDADYALSEFTVAFSNVNTRVLITLTNNSPKFETFLLRKRDHTLYDGDTGSTMEDPYDGTECTPGKDCPLFWLEIGPEGQAAVAQSASIGVEGNGGTRVIEIGAAAGVNAPRWDGRLEVIHPTLGNRTITLSYSEKPEGRWHGRVYYFATFGDRDLAPWMADRTNSDKVKQVGNALIRRWGAFRQGDMSLDELMAVLLSTRNESWRWPGVKADCPSATGACYPYDGNDLGLVAYTSNLASNPIPTGVVELPISMNLHLPDPVGAPGFMSGRIESTLTLQYAGDPAVTLDFGSDPAGCELDTLGACIVFIDTMEADVLVGGRYTTDASDVSCSQAAGGFQPVAVPWLVPGFQLATEEQPLGSGLRYRTECRDQLLPYEPPANEDLSDLLAASNRNLARSNPVPDGRTRRRKLRLVDGALINQKTLLIIFKETFESFLPGDSQPFSAYGYMLMEREAADLDLTDSEPDNVPDVYQGTHPVDERPEPQGLLDTQCSPAVVQQALGSFETTVTDANVGPLVKTLLSGRRPASSESLIGPSSPEQVHYLCGQNGLFDGGSQATTDIYESLPNDDSCGFASPSDNHLDKNGVCDDGGPGSKTAICPIGTDEADCGNRTAADGDFRVPCPVGSNVIFFTLPGAEYAQADIADLACQDDGSCQDTLDQWIADGTVTQVNPVWRCENPAAVFCDEDRLDLRDGKLFYSAADTAAVMEPLQALIQLAFRYRTQFVARDGDSPGFAPALCTANAKAVPYCYDPPTIEAIEARIDCLLHAWRHHYDALVNASGLSAGAADDLNSFLCANFAYAEACEAVAQTGTVHDGFERFYSELLVMMGDESYTRAFSSRFDLVGKNPISFEGALFEDTGINLSGAAGYEMYSLYQATQYYDMALDRFYRMAPAMWEAMGYGFSSRNFVTLETVTRYLERLIRASTQKSRAWSEVAKRYQAFNRPDLSRRVIARAYTATYVESVVLSRLMLAIVETLKPEDRPQVLVSLEQGQRRYRTAMADMQNVYSDITDDVRFFGLAPDFVPFPAPPPFGANDSAVEVIIARAKQKVEVARVREDIAIERSKAFETDEAEFQSELIRLRNTYESQLGDICGTFPGPDGKIYPAITQYAELDPRLARFGDPCGMAGNGAVYQAMAEFEIAGLDMRRIRTSYDNTVAEIDIERSRVQAQCNLIFTNADFVYEKQGNINTLQKVVSTARFAVSGIDRVLGYAGTLAHLSKCSVGTSTDCPSGAVAALTYGNAAFALQLAAVATEAGITQTENQILDMQTSLAKWETQQQCDAALIDANARMASVGLRLKEIEVEALRAQYQVRLAIARLQQQMNTARRLQDELDEARELAVNVFAARTDPNVRIYRDDAIVNAEVAFEDAIREAYRATRVYEYYTSQSYADREKLFLIRMVQYGEYNLQNYLNDLENAFFEFEDTYGIPDTRVARLSLRDDLLNLPRLRDDGTPYDTNERIGMMRARLADPALLDENGYLSIAFRTTLEDLSPLTRVHKVDYVEAEIIGSEVGDTVARLYLRARGTGVVHGLDDQKQFFRFPERTGVINPFLNGNKIFDPSVYRTFHLRDRPFVNTAWELVINQRDEKVNQDINLQSLTDIRLYVYYRDFTQF